MSEYDQEIPHTLGVSKTRIPQTEDENEISKCHKRTENDYEMPQTNRVC